MLYIVRNRNERIARTVAYPSRDDEVLKLILRAVPEFEPRFLEWVADEGSTFAMEEFAEWLVDHTRTVGPDDVSARSFGAIERLLTDPAFARGPDDHVPYFLQQIPDEPVFRDLMGPETRQRFDSAVASAAVAPARRRWRLPWWGRNSPEGD